MSDRPPGKQSKKSRLLRPIKDLFSKSLIRSPSHHGTQSVPSDNAIASRSALPTNSGASASQVNPQSHQEVQSVAADNAIASISVQVNPQSAQGTQPVTPDDATASISASLVKSTAPAPQVNSQGGEYTAILELSPTPSGPLTWEHQMKAYGSTAYEGLKTAIQGIYNCSGAFPPLQSAAGVLLTICTVVDVRGSMYSACNYFFSQFILPFQKVSANKTDLEQLRVKLQSILSIISKYRENDGLPALAYRVENFCLYVRSYVLSMPNSLTNPP